MARELQVKEIINKLRFVIFVMTMQKNEVLNTLHNQYLRFIYFSFSELIDLSVDVCVFIPMNQ